MGVKDDQLFLGRGVLGRSRAVEGPMNPAVIKLMEQWREIQRKDEGNEGSFKVGHERKPV